MILTKSDNDVIIKHIYEFNKSVDIGDKMAIDVYINSIEFLDSTASSVMPSCCKR